MKISSLQLPAQQPSFFLVSLDSLYSLPSDSVSGLAQQLVDVVQPHASGLVLDPVATFPQLKLQPSFPLGLALRLERWSESNPVELPVLESDWGVEAIRHNAAVAKLSLWYHPLEEHAVDKKQFLIEIHDYCQHLGIDLFLELKPFELGKDGDSEASKAETIIRMIEDVRGLAELVALPWPEDSLTAATITAELDIPWLLSWGAAPPNIPPYEGIKEQLRQALESGASGCVVGNHLWQEILTEQDAQKPQDFIGTTVRDRVIELSRLVKEAVV